MTLRIITATALFDGHDAAINIFRRILVAKGAEVIHLGHNRSVREIVRAAVEEDAQGIAVSSYQGGHMEFFKYMIDLLREKGAGHIRVFGGGGGVIMPEEIDELEAYGVARIYSPDDGAKLGLQGIISHMLEQLKPQRRVPVSKGIKKKTHLIKASSGDGTPNHKIALKRIDSEPPNPATLSRENKSSVAEWITAVEAVKADSAKALSRLTSVLSKKTGKTKVPVIGVTGTGGAGKSSLTDELALRFLHHHPALHLAIISCDPSRRKTGGALLGDRIRMNAIDSPRVYMRSLATRKSRSELPDALPEIILTAKAAGYDLIIVETAGIGQGDSRIVDLTDVSVYVMTSEFGAPSQLEKIDMLDFADLVVINKFEKRGGEDALREVRKQVRRNKGAFDQPLEEMPVFGTIAARFNDDGVTALYHGLLNAICDNTGIRLSTTCPKPDGRVSETKTIIIPPERIRYLSEIAQTVREYHRTTKIQTDALRHVWHLRETLETMAENEDAALIQSLKAAVKQAEKAVSPETLQLNSQWKQVQTDYSRDDLIYRVRDREVRTPLFVTSLSGKRIPKVALPRFEDPGALYQWLRNENLPGHFPYTAGTFPLKRVDEEPTRMFAGEGDPVRTNRRFRLLSADYKAKRLSTAFDSVTLYGFDPDRQPDIYGKIGTSGVSVCSLDDMKTLYDGFDLANPATSVSMTINGPAPIILAMFFNAALDQQLDRQMGQNTGEIDEKTGSEVLSQTISRIRGTVQADILKEDQGQNTCIFSIEFALKMMGDIQRYFIDHDVKNFYSVSISGYHIAEAGANPISQLAFTLANGFTYVEYYLSRGMALDDFAHNLSFFFSNGLDPEYTVIGRVARRIWAVAIRDKYGANPRSRRLKYHIQTSGRSLHSRDIQFNDIRTTLQALCAVYDNCNSLHTNAFDEAITTPSAESVRRALAIQMIINREWGLSKNENPLQGSFIVEELTDLVEEAVLMEFDRITERGGVPGAMETGYQRSRIQEESMVYEGKKHTGELPIIGVNTFLDTDAGDDFSEGPILALARATEAEKKSQLRRLSDFHKRNRDKAPQALTRLRETAFSGGNIFAELMHTVRVASLGQITQALYEVGGKYRRNM